MNSENQAPRSLRDIEMDVLAEGREWFIQDGRSTLAN
jgi:hypothetical protein